MYVGYTRLYRVFMRAAWEAYVAQTYAIRNDSQFKMEQIQRSFADGHVKYSTKPSVKGNSKPCGSSSVGPGQNHPQQ